ncbi:MAG TPA: lytic transglycosylase domain-containing protein [Chitinophagaceae bacterium]|nr:lytic transglycosylase domain-containing protein [Chitinophagaceae bacterium]
MKKFLLLPCFLLLLSLFANAQQAVSIESSAVALESVSAAKDSINTAGASAAPAGKKKGFKDLFDNDNTAYTAGPRLNPRAISFVEDYIEKNSEDLEEMRGWGKPYFNVMDAILISHNLPKELKYLAVIESRLHTSAVSWAGAVGPWQLMPATARVLGLKVNHKTDERTNYIKSTHAAAKYLNDLYDQFGDWLLVIAAYNGGAGNVLKAIRKSGSRNFWDLQYYLPAESRNHVKKFIGTHYIFEGQGGLTTLTKKETDENYGVNGTYIFNRRLNAVELEEAKSQTISGKYHSLVIARNIVMGIADFNRYNPDFDKVMASASNSYEIKLPADKMELFIANKYQILNESIQLLLNNAANTAATATSTASSKDSTIMATKMAKK